MNTKVLTITSPTGVVNEIHLLNPGEYLPGFGGSRVGLTVTGRTASIVVRTSYPAADCVQTDREIDLRDAAFWNLIRHAINRTDSRAE